ncbi:MAG: ArsA family ATPase [Candidatus Rokuibacteriota bacterium]|nr:MAG: ArsA family ATPase [Candidatus Rokubacteria bacterium]
MSAARRRPPPRPARDGGGAVRFHFFAGKGGVGKTTCAAAAALAAAESGRRVVVVSTDPAHSLGDALGRRVGPVTRRVPVRAGRLEAIELDADRALARWLARRRGTLRTIAERGTYLDEEDLERLLRLSFPGVDELMALVELGRLARQGRYELVVVDTAPTGHALRLLGMPETLRRVAGVLNDLYAKHRFLADSLGRGYRAGPADRLIEELDADGRRLAALLRDAERCRFTWLLLAEELTLEETRDGVAALAREGMRAGELLINRLTPAPDPPCALCGARARLRTFARRLGSRGQAVDLESDERVVASRPPVSEKSTALKSPTTAVAAPAWLDAIAPPTLRLLVFAGKGGVGKTSCAAAAALALAGARPDARVVVLSVDPAHSLGDALAVALADDERAVPGAPPGLRAREVDADRAFARLRARYQRGVEETFESLLRGSRFDVAYDREALRGLMDLAPPGLDELFAVLTVVETLFEREPPADVVVLDTAPTGHALRLLEMPATALGWVHALLAILLKYREVVGLGDVAAELVATARRLRELGALLTDGDRARVVAVARAAELPQRETERLLERLRRLRITAPAVLVNALTSGDCRRCRRARRVEDRWVAALAPGRGTRRRGWGMICTPAVAPPPRGVAGLAGWARTWELQ